MRRHANVKMGRLLNMSGLVILLVTGASCPTLHGLPSHCVTKAEWPRYGEVAVSKRGIFKPDADDQPTQHRELAGRVSYLEGRCIGINALRNDR